jgi:hypothetical protein
MSPRSGRIDEMAHMDPETEAVRVYRRTLDEVVATQAVAAAEDVLTDAWVAELEQTRRDAVADGDRALSAQSAARERVHKAEQAADPAELALAQAQLLQCESAQTTELEKVRVLVEAVDAELEHACVVGVERAQRLREDLSRLGAAWTDAYGD